MTNNTKKGNSTISLEKEFEDSMISFHYRMISEFRKKSKDFGFTVSHIEVLHYVIEKVNPTMKDIAEHLKIKPPSVTTIIEKLCKKKLLKKEIGDKDKRVARVSVTPNIWKVINSIKGQRILILKDMFCRLNDKDKSELIRIINILNKK